MTLPEIFFNPKQAREMGNHSSKKKPRIKRKGEKNSKFEKPKAIGHFLVQNLKILISAHAWPKMS